MAILSAPLEASLRTGFVLCPSFGIEQIHLLRVEALAARSLSEAGFSVLRFHNQGYGDSEGAIDETRLSSHLAGAEDAVELMAGRTGIDQVGVLGARVGGMLAALVAERRELPLLAMWEPAVSGAHLMRDLFRSQVLHRVMREAAEGNNAATGEGTVWQPREGVKAELERQGWADIRGFPLNRATYDEFCAVDLRKDITRFRGTALLVSVSRNERMTANATGLASHLRGLGARCTVEVVQDRTAAQFGQHHHANLPGGIKTDLHFALTRSLAEITTRWASSQVSGTTRIAGEAS